MNRPLETASVDHDLAALAAADPQAALALAKGEPDGLSEDEVAARLKRFGPNVIAREGRPSIIAAFMLAYATLTHLVKSWFIRRWGF